MTSIVFVCTGNICRSPMAASFMSRIAEKRKLEVQVTSAGILEAGHSPTREGIQAMSEHGLDVSRHLSSTIEDNLVVPADVIVTMAREHTRRIVESRPELWARTFTLKELVRLAAQTGPRGRDEAMQSYLSRVGSHRRISQLASMVSRTDDIDDPIGRSLKTYRECAREISELVSELADLLWQETSITARTELPSG